MNQRKNEPNKFRRNAPIDGVSGRPPTRFNQGSGSIGVPSRPATGRSATPHRSQPNNAIQSGFKRTDGFHPTQQQQIRRSTPTPQETVFIEKHSSTKKKRGLFGRKKHSGNLSKKKPLSKKKKIFRVVAVVLAIILLVGGFLAVQGYINLRKVLSGGGGAAALQQNVDPSKLKGEGDGRVNILMLGRGGEGHEGADLTDTIIIASIDPIAKEAALVSVPRDLYVPVDDQGSMKINSVFATGKSSYYYGNDISVNDSNDKKAEQEGFKLLEKTLEQTLGIPVHYHVMVDFEGFKQAIDTVGGVTVNAPGEVYERLYIDGQNYVLDVDPGVQTMDGFRALAYARSRYTSPRGDFDRAERQRLIITALKDKVLSAGTFGNPQKISQLTNNFGNHVQTNFSVEDLQRLYQLSQEIPSDKIGSIGLSDPPNNFVTTSNIGGASVVIPTAGVGNYKDIQSFMRNALKDSYLKSESANIMVLNGTTRAGFASEKAEELKSFGYTVPEVGNAPTKNYPTTIIVNLKGEDKKYTQNYLEKRFGVTATNTLPDPAIVPGTADFVIILGTDQANL